jgi:hypothetical protein
MLKARAKTQLQVAFLAMDGAYENFSARLNDALQEVERRMNEGGVKTIGLGQGIPKRIRGAESKIKLVSIKIVRGRAVFGDGFGRSHQPDTLDIESLHLAVARVRGSSSLAKIDG